MALADNFQSGGGGVSIHPQARAAAPTTAWNGEPMLDDRPGQSFTGQGGVLQSFGLNLSYDQGNPAYPDGDAVIRIYAHAGTFGTSSAPLNAAAEADTPTPGWLAESDPLTFTPSDPPTGMTDFTFSGVNRITLTNGTRYVGILTWRPNDTDQENTVSVSGDGIGPDPPGNEGDYHAGNVYVDGYSNNFSQASWDLYFRVYEDTGLPAGVVIGNRLA